MQNHINAESLSLREGLDRLSSLQNLTQGGAQLFQKNPECEEGTKMEALVAIFWFEAGASERRGHWRLARFIF